MMTVGVLLPNVISPVVEGVLTMPMRVGLAAALGVLFGLQITVLRLFFRKRTSAPAAYVAVAWLTFVCATAVNAFSVGAGMPGSNMTFSVGFGMGRSAIELLLAVVWTLYMRRSQRVRATFEGRAPPAAGGAAFTAPTA